MSARVLVAGAGVFGMHLAREVLRSTDATIVLAARNQRRLQAAAASLGAADRVEMCRLDLSRPASLREAAETCAVVACAAGPFNTLSRRLPHAAVEAGAHWVDLADEPGWVLGLLGDKELDRAAEDAGVAVIPGRSTVPALSGALVAWGRRRVPDAYRAQIVLTIGNRNPKGIAAISAAAAGRFRNPSLVATPLGVRPAWRFDAPDPSLLEPEVHADFRVALEWPAASVIVAAAHRAPAALRGPFARASAAASRLVSGWGHEGGAVQAEVFDPRGRSIGAALRFPQRVAVAPAAFAIEAILRGEKPPAGVVEPEAWPGHAVTLDDAIARGALFLAPRVRAAARTG